jgi:hypothetical protein
MFSCLGCGSKTDVEEFTGGGFDEVLPKVNIKKNARDIREAPSLMGSIMNDIQGMPDQSPSYRGFISEVNKWIGSVPKGQADKYLNLSKAPSELIDLAESVLKSTSDLRGNEKTILRKFIESGGNTSTLLGYRKGGVVKGMCKNCKCKGMRTGGIVNPKLQEFINKKPFTIPILRKPVLGSYQAFKNKTII